MLSIGEKEVVTGFTKDELDIIDNLLSEQKADMNSHINTIDNSKYIDICQLQGKIFGLIKLFENKKSINNGRIADDTPRIYDGR